MSLIVAGTGHRPEDCEDEGIVRIKAQVKLRYSGATCFVCGMASGFDLWAADEARLLGIDIWAARPWAGHKPRRGDEELYDTILSASSRVINVSESETFPGNWAYTKRNEWMVDNADVVMAYWNGKESGGTYGCRNYAKKVGRPVANIYYDPPF